jgi:hypothetical protein
MDAETLARSRREFSMTRNLSQTILHCCLCFLFLGLIGCASSTPRFKASAAKEISEERTENNVSVDIDEAIPEIVKSAEEDTIIHRIRMLDEMLVMLGTPYNYSGTTENGIDCSGFTSLVYQRTLGKLLPHSSSDQFEQGNDIDAGNLRFGDLVFFNTTGEIPSHVGIYVGFNLFIHASVSQGVTVSSLKSDYYRKRFVGARRIIE